MLCAASRSWQWLGQWSVCCWSAELGSSRVGRGWDGSCQPSLAQRLFTWPGGGWLCALGAGGVVVNETRLRSWLGAARRCCSDADGCGHRGVGTALPAPPFVPFMELIQHGLGGWQPGAGVGAFSSSTRGAFVPWDGCVVPEQPCACPWQQPSPHTFLSPQQGGVKTTQICFHAHCWASE